MTRPVAWTPDARADLNSITEYIARDSPQNALAVWERIDHAANVLAAEHLGQRGRVSGTYEIPVPRTKYILSYALIVNVARTEETVILHIIHGARDWREGRWPDE